MKSRVALILAAASLTLIALAISTGAVFAKDQSAVAFITGLYALPEPQSKARYSPRLEKLWAECYRQEKEQGFACLDFDMFVMAQDTEMSGLKIEQQSGDANKAVVQAQFKNFGEDHTVTFDLLHDDKGWMIDEMRSGCYILTELLQEQSNC
jgi:hypothetical protein